MEIFYLVLMVVFYGPWLAKKLTTKLGRRRKHREHTPLYSRKQQLLVQIEKAARGEYSPW